MSPEVETLRIIELQGIKIDYFTVDLNSPETFDPALFDKQIETVVGFRLQEKEMKFIVVGDAMYVFPQLPQHANFYSSLQDSGITGKLQCGGFISVDTRERYQT